MTEIVEQMPIGYARALLPRIEHLLEYDMPPSIRRQWEAVRDALTKSNLHWCIGLDRLHYMLSKSENACIR